MACSGCDEEKEATSRQLELFAGDARWLQQRYAAMTEANLASEPVDAHVAFLERLEELRAGLVKLRARVLKATERVERYEAAAKRNAGEPGNRNVVYTSNRGRK